MQSTLVKFTSQSPLLVEQRRIVAYLDGLQAKVNALRELRPFVGRTWMPSVLDKAFKGEL